MNVVFRVDASIIMGTGHVMRCLTLADALKQWGVKVQFICRKHPGNLMSFIENKGYQVFSLQNDRLFVELTEKLTHAKWLGCSQHQDAMECEAVLQGKLIDWLIVDHYALDINWEKILKPFYKKLMVIDDLADRQHDCDILLDQTYGRKRKDYLPWITEHCQLLLGSDYALLRPEFFEWREYSLKRRIASEFKHLLITMGGVDQDNVTGDILNVLKQCKLPKDLKITVIMGATAPHIDVVKKIAQTMLYKMDIKIGVNNMAEIMAYADIAIGAAGATTWERCCLGLPTIVVVLAENQKEIANFMVREKKLVLINRSQIVDICLSINFVRHKLKEISMASSEVTDGRGVSKIIKYIV